ncbi:hypothetical protein QYF36_016957 [Acer negundo]|nr:hypothetical protein QYF36_016957 [Acer negundo]
MEKKASLRLTFLITLFAILLCFVHGISRSSMELREELDDQTVKQLQQQNHDPRSSSESYDDPPKFSKNRRL